MTKTGLFTPEEVLRLLETSKTATRAKYLPIVMDIALNTGISRKNISKLTLNDFHEWSKNQFFIRVGFDEPSVVPAGKKYNEIPVESSFQSRIFKQVAKRNAEFHFQGIKLPENLKKLVVLSNKGTPVTPNQISQTFSTLLRKLFLQKDIEERHLVFRSLRKVFAFYLLKVKEFSFERVSKMLGHSTLAQTIEFLGVEEYELQEPTSTRSEQLSVDYSRGIESISSPEHVRQAYAKEFEQKREIDAEIMSIIGSSVLSPKEKATHKSRLRDLLKERDEISSHIPSLREIELDTTLKNLKRRYNDLLKELTSEARLKELGKYEKVYERKIEKQLKLQIKDRVKELHDQGFGYRTIADIINQEYATNYHFTTMKNWLS